MGTNYYLRPANACPNRCSSWIHLGKSSIGWTFTFQAFPASEWDEPPGGRPVTDFASWVKLLDLGNVFDEYSRPVTRADLLELIEAKRDHGRHNLHGDDWFDADGHYFVNREFS